MGPIGTGKTTLTYLIPRLYDPSDGRVLLDGHDLRDVTLESLTAHIGMVTQETHLFHDTIRTNLLYVKLDATQSEIEAAARPIFTILRLLKNHHCVVLAMGCYTLPMLIALL